MAEEKKMKRVADFLHEVGMLRRTPRTGYQFLGSGGENVAEHSFRTTVIGFVLARMAGANPEKTAMLCLFHDLHEARTGDFNYVNRIYNDSRRTDALKDCLAGTGLEQDVLGFWRELESAGTPEALLAQDADQIDLILNLAEELNLGNARAAKWIELALERLRTPEGQALGRQAAAANPTDWWMERPPRSWWTRANGGKPPRGGSEEG